jgi:hypothetical protein
MHAAVAAEIPADTSENCKTVPSSPPAPPSPPECLVQVSALGDYGPFRNDNQTCPQYQYFCQGGFFGAGTPATQLQPSRYLRPIVFRLTPSTTDRCVRASTRNSSLLTSVMLLSSPWNAPGERPSACTGGLGNGAELEFIQRAGTEYDVYVAGTPFSGPVTTFPFSLTGE